MALDLVKVITGWEGSCTNDNIISPDFLLDFVQNE